LLLLCYITDRRQFSGNDDEQRRRLLDKMAEAAAAGVDYVQLREKDLPARELERLAAEARERMQSVRSPRTTRLLINSRSDVALAAGADGVHLRSDDISAAEARALWRREPSPVVGVSCHTEAEVRLAAGHGADFAVFAPVFEKKSGPGAGLEALRAVCRGVAPASGVEAGPAIDFPVLALGGVTVENARECRRAGAAGVAGIRLFQQDDISQVVSRLRAISEE
jgi:thiamine-phosphate pyrophosphorylase